MLNKRLFLTLVVLLGLAILANAQTRIIASRPTNGPCTAVETIASPAPGIPPQPTGWEIVAGYKVLFTSSELEGLPFATGTTLNATSTTPDSPIFGCDANLNLYLQVVNMDGTMSIVQKPLNGAWEFLFGKYGTLQFPNPGQQPGTVGLSPLFNQATRFVSQGNKTVMIGEFGTGLKKYWRAYEVPSRNFVADFGHVDTDSLDQTCTTNQNLWFSMRVGTWFSLYQVADGVVSEIVPTDIPAANSRPDNTVTLSCYPLGANLQIVSADLKTSADYPLTDRVTVNQ